MTTFPDLAAAEAKANEVLKAYFISDPFIDASPIIAQSIAEFCGLNVRYSSFKPEYSDVAGFIDTGTNTIVINAEDTAACRNFTAAHELGHYLLGHYKESGYSCLFRDRSKREETTTESEADYFAVSLLVPAKLFQEMTNKYPLAADDILAKPFGVPEYVIKFRRIV
jgi:Zn-dependent peptidase ImmA (M78 family)